MDQSRMRELSQEIITGETVELNLMKLYKALLDEGLETLEIEDVVKRKMTEGMAILYQDSVRHKTALDVILKKYL